MKSIVTFAGVATACLLPHERCGDACDESVPFRPKLLASDGESYPVGTGDRFANGSLPLGVGVAHDKDFGSILNTNEILSGISALAKGYPSLKLWSAPQTTIDGNTMMGLTLGSHPRVFIEGGIHARERGGPDYVLYFLADLLAAQKAKIGITYGNVTYTAEDVDTAVSAGIVLLPLVNPDGVAYDQRTDSCWRKNRNPASATNGQSASVGVDLNRNFDFLWDYKHKFSKGANLGAAASDDPSSELFHGTQPFSEAETQNVAWVMDQHPSLSWFLDLHSYAGDILYAWGDDDFQSTDPSQNFANTTYDDARGIMKPAADPPGAVYKEYITADDIAAQQNVTSRMASSMNKAGGITYKPIQSSHLYPTAGGSNDYALGRFYGGKRCGASKLNGLTIEFGSPDYLVECPFYPANEDTYVQSMRQVGAGLMEMVLNAAGPAGETEVVKC